MPKSSATLAVALALAVPFAAHAFSGSGKESYNEGMKYLGGRATADEAAAIRGMAEPDRLQKGIDSLLDAERQADTPAETEQVTRTLGLTYNKLALLQGDAKDYRNAAYSLAEAIKRMPEDPVLHWNLGNFQFEAGEFSEAAASFSKAREKAAPDLKPRAEQAMIHAYMAQAKNGDANAYDYAIKELENLSYERPNDLELQYLLGDNYRLKGDSAKALEIWEKARQQGAMPPGWEDLYQKLKSAQSIKADKQFASDASVHFKIDFEDKAQGGALARKFLDMFEAAWDEVGLKYGVRAESVVFITVYTGDQFNAAVKIPWAGGVHSENHVDLRISPHLTDAQYKDTIFHEYTHHVIGIKAGQKIIPQWLNEGLAMHSEATLDLKQFLPILDAVLRKKKKCLPFSRIAGTFTTLPSDLHVRLAYAQGYSMVDAMIERFGFDSIGNILKSMSTGGEFEESFRSVTRVTWADFEKQWLEQHLQAAEDAHPVAAALTPPAGGGPGFDGLEGGKRRPTPGLAPQGGSAR